MNCSICKRDTPDQCIEKHHLIPKAKKGKECIDVCCDCGNMIHQLFDNKFLAKSLNTLALLLSNDKIQKWVNWIQNKPGFGFCMARKKRA